jgi:hypothetical protein
MSDYTFVADVFVDQLVGGGELNDYEVKNQIESRGYSTSRIHSHLLSPANLTQDTCYVVSNFLNLPPRTLKSIKDHKYVIYEHDHKYLRRRNPALYADFLAPKDDVVNLELYQNALGVLCQSKFHFDIVQKNTGLDNLINLGGNMWDLKSLEHMRTIAGQEKNDFVAVMASNIPHKNTKDAIRYCVAKNEKYQLVSDKEYLTFLNKLGKNKKFVFFPQTPETLSRVCVEARMMNMSVVLNKLVGARSEPWFSLKGEELIDHMTNKRDEIVDTILEVTGEL